MSEFDVGTLDSHLHLSGGVKVTPLHYPSGLVRTRKSGRPCSMQGDVRPSQDSGRGCSAKGFRDLPVTMTLGIRCDYAWWWAVVALCCAGSVSGVGSWTSKKSKRHSQGCRRLTPSALRRTATRFAKCTSSPHPTRRRSRWCATSKTLALARFGITIDRRAISVVQIGPERLDPGDDRPAIKGVHEIPEGTRTTVAVTLAWHNEGLRRYRHGTGRTRSPHAPRRRGRGARRRVAPPRRRPRTGLDRLTDDRDAHRARGRRGLHRRTRGRGRRRIGNQPRRRLRSHRAEQCSMR